MSIKRLIALILLAAAIVALAFSIGSTPSLYLYNTLAPQAGAPQVEGEAQTDADKETVQDVADQPKPPEQKPLSPLAQALKGLDEKMGELSTAQGGYMARVYTSGVAFSDGLSGSATGGLQGLWGDVSLEPRAPLLFGRHLYHEELAEGRQVAVIDEKLAIELYRIADPLGRDLVIGGKAFEVVGIVRHSRQMGEVDAFSAHVPLNALDRLGIQSQILSVLVKPLKGAGAYAALSQGLGQWQPGGSFHSYEKEKYRSMLPLRLLLCFTALMLIALSLKLARIWTKRLYQGGRERLEIRYAQHMLPELTLRLVLVILLYALNLLLIFLVLRELIAPVYIFPEWVPTVLVEPKDIIRTFWQLRTQESVLMSLRTPELLRLRFLHRLMTLACALLGLLLLRPWYLARDALQEQTR